MAISTALIFLFIFAFLVNDKVFPWLKVEVVRTISLFLSLLIAGFIAGYIARSRGAIHGFIACTSIYIIPLLVFSIIAFYGVYFEKAHFAGNTKDLVDWLKPYIQQVIYGGLIGSVGGLVGQKVSETRHHRKHRIITSS